MGKLKNAERHAGVMAPLPDIVNEAVASLPFDCCLVEGVRSPERQQQLYAQGRTKPGPIVTWTLKSKHIDRKAEDVYPLLDNGQLDNGMSPHGLARFDALYHAIILAAAKRKVRIRYGGDWDMDGKLREKGETDSPHFELN